jgi:hypothetical protein
MSYTSECACCLPCRPCCTCNSKANVNRLLEDPYSFEDFRDAKASGKLLSGHPDFRSFDGSCAVWCDNTHIDASMKQRLAELPADLPQGTPAGRYKRKWDALLANPAAYEDMRVYKSALQQRASLPDFRVQGSNDAATAIWIEPSFPETAVFMERLAMCSAGPRVMNPDE